ncbi:hypothetical protein R5R35_013726 [Gryllus longicercus]|uniref:Matrix metalloproteinase n=1 Tax=Gryllus longicercus TaxID=2509291 RepID=A0AAN9VW91_9ORTH
MGSGAVAVAGAGAGRRRRRARDSRDVAAGACAGSRPRPRLRLRLRLRHLPRRGSAAAACTAGAWVFRHDGRRLSPPAPLPLARTWPGLPADGVDAAFAARSGKLFFFKGARYWRYSAAGQPPDHGYPRPLRLGFPGAPAAPDAALLWPANGQLYFFKGPLYWRYAGPRGAGAGAAAGAGRGYPRAVSAWRGVPAPPDAALAFRGHTYFFKGDSYVRFNDSAFAVEEAWPPFPRPIARWWFKCRSAHPPSPPPTPSMQPSEDALSDLLHALQPTTEV